MSSFAHLVVKSMAASVIDPKLPTSLSEFSNVSALQPVIIFVGLPVAVGLIFGILGPIFMCIFWCCRCCRCCGGRLPGKSFYPKAQIRKVQIAYVVFCLVVIAGSILGYFYAPKLDDGVNKMYNVYDEFFAGVNGVIDGIYNGLDTISPTISAQGAVVQQFVDGLQVFLNPIDNIATTINGLNQQVVSLQSGLTVAQANLTDTLALLADVSNTSSSYGLASAPSTGSMPSTSSLSSSATALSSALASLATAQTTVSNMRTSANDSINSVSGQIQPSLNSAASTVDSSLGPVKDQLTSTRKMIADQKSTTNTYMDYIHVSDGYRTIGGWVTYGVGLFFMLIGLLAFFIKNHRFVACFSFVCWVGTFIFFILFAIETGFGQTLDVYCVNYPTMLETTIPNELSGTAKDIPQILTCDGTTNLFDIFGYRNKFNVSDQIDMSSLTGQAQQLNRTSDIQNAQSDVNSVVGNIAGTNINLGQFDTVLGQLQNISAMCSDIRNFDNPASSGSKISDSDIVAAQTALAALNTAIGSGSGWALTTCANSPDALYWGCTANSCPNTVRIPSLEAAYNVTTSAWAPPNALDKCPFSDLDGSTVPTANAFLTQYAQVWPVAKVEYIANTTKPKIDKMISNLEGMQAFATTVQQFTSTGVNDAVANINTELGNINLLSQEAVTNLTNTANKVVDNISVFVESLLNVGRCKWFGDVFRDFNDAICGSFQPGLLYMGYGHLLLGASAFACYFIAIVASKRYFAISKKKDDAGDVVSYGNQKELRDMSSGHPGLSNSNAVPYKYPV